MAAAEKIIKVTTPSFSANPALRSELLKSFPRGVLYSEKKRMTRRELSEFLADADGAVIGLDRVDGELLKNCPKIKVIAKYGVAIDNIDIGECENRGVKVSWTQGVNKTSVAELALGFMLSLCRNSFVTSADLKSGRWNKNGGFELSSKTVGIIGVGHIGKELIRLLKPFQCQILANDIIDQSAYYKENALKDASKDEIFRTSDIVSLHTPLTGKTRRMVSEKTLRSMKKTAYLINTARGPIVDQEALKKALQSGIIAGGAIDVYEEEPPTDMELLKLPNLFCTPHIGGNSAEAVLSMGRSAIEHLKSFFGSDEDL